ncbi:MAG: hypothetical protein JKX84_02005 [Flavobacteriales bacterium]|nr:hypothetical protein [Flavobacteriales bacterium]
MQDRWLFIINPASANGKGGIKWKSIHQQFQKAGFNPIVWSSEYKGHIEQLIERACHEGFRKIASYGGDGSLSAAANAIMKQTSCAPEEVLLAHYPAGTGNDWCRMFNVPNNPKDWVGMVNTDLQFRHDVGSIDLIKEGKPAAHYFVNIAGAAYVAKCAILIDEANTRDSLFSGKWFYDYIVFKSLLSYKFPRMTLKFNGTERTEKVFNLAVGICRFNGGGMMNAPFANPSDGLLDITLFQKMSKLRAILDYPKLRNGTIFLNPQISGYRTGRLELTATGKAEPIEADGEFVGYTPATFGIEKQALRFVIGSIPKEKEFPLEKL